MTDAQNLYQQFTAIANASISNEVKQLLLENALKNYSTEPDLSPHDDKSLLPS